LAFLELMEPSLSQAVEVHVAQGVNTIDVYPLFLAAGGHLKRDLPQEAAALMASYAGLAIHLHPPVGELAAVQQAMASAIAHDAHVVHNRTASGPNPSHL
jgi:sirohydrochlorin cobaltochelatase